MWPFKRKNKYRRTNVLEIPPSGVYAIAIVRELFYDSNLAKISGGRKPGGQLRTPDNRKTNFDVRLDLGKKP